MWIWMLRQTVQTTGGSLRYVTFKNLGQMSEFLLPNVPSRNKIANIMVDKDAIAQAVKAQLQLLYGDRLAKVILYGSYARGDFHEESDIDFLVVLKDEEIAVGKELRAMSEPIFDISFKNDIIISKHPTTLTRFENSQFLFYKNIRKEGVEIA